MGFDPAASRAGTAETAATDLQSLIASQANDGWEFVTVANHSTVVPGSSGCFGFGASDPYPQTVSMAVFRR